MQQIKFFKKDGQSFIRLGNQDYKGYTVGSMPQKFAFIYNEEKDQDGISEWFNYKGLTYVPKSDNPWA